MAQRPFLPVDEDSLDNEIEREFDLDKMSANDYLKQVIFERKKIPQVVTVHPMRSNDDMASENPSTVSSHSTLILSSAFKDSVILV